MQKRWTLLPSPENDAVLRLCNELKIDTVLSQLLLQRDIKNFQEAERFFRPKLSELHDPFLLLNMASAVERLEEALVKKQKILLYGDYDVDGTTSVALLFHFLREKSEQLQFYIPDRYSEGYGVSQSAMEWAVEEKFDLLITLDCGIKNVKELNWIKEKGVDVIVCDHHEPGETIPEAIVLNPKQVGCPYPFKELCGCGVAFKLLQALITRSIGNEEEIMALLDFVALAIGADIVSVQGENRILAYHGLNLINEVGRPCFDVLLQVAGRAKPVTLTDVVFTIAPRINAAGRIFQASEAVELMLSSSPEEIKERAEKINEYNSTRRNLDESITTEALEQIINEPDFENRRTNLAHKEGWSKGVVGIVASRLIEQHYKPTIVFAEEDGILTGSARTVNDFDIHHCLVQCEDLLLKFGGHTHAAGLSLTKNNLPAFKSRFENIVAESIAVEDLQPTVSISLEIQFSDIFKAKESRTALPRLKRLLDLMEPHGPQNMKPVFLTRNVYATDARVLKDKHLKLTVTQPDTTLNIAAIGFSLADKLDDVASGVPFDIAYTIESNTWKDKTTLQLNIKDIRPTF